MCWGLCCAPYKIVVNFVAFAPQVSSGLAYEDLVRLHQRCAAVKWCLACWFGCRLLHISVRFQQSYLAASVLAKGGVLGC
ncbi:hypothetical protein U1Q18_038484 [Sarracenia purpurea var. burkii]